jgi:hypothetical protein
MKKVLMMAAVCLMAAMTFAAQCAATTKKGTQCKRQASPGSEVCWQHGGTTKAQRAANGESEAPKRSRKAAQAEPEAPAANDAPAAVEGQCQATTKRGTQCRRKAVEGGKYCAQHAARMSGGESEAPAARPKRVRKPKSEAAAGPAAKPSEPTAASGMCQGKSKNGEPCKRKAKPGSNFCWQHEK